MTTWRRSGPTVGGELVPPQSDARMRQTVKIQQIPAVTPVVRKRVELVLVRPERSIRSRVVVHPSPELPGIHVVFGRSVAGLARVDDHELRGSCRRGCAVSAAC